MLFLDTILLSPIYGTIWAARQVRNAIDQDRVAEPARITTELSELYMSLETGRITEAEFEAREKELLDQLDRLQEEEPEPAVKPQPQGKTRAPRAQGPAAKKPGRTQPGEETTGPKVQEKRAAGQALCAANLIAKTAAVALVSMFLGVPSALAEGTPGLTHASTPLAAQRLAALAMVETGGGSSEKICPADWALGRSGEVSRYQILPAVWREHHQPPAYRNPAVAKRMVERIMEARTAVFVRDTGRAPTDFEWYLLWHRPGAFARTGYRAPRLSAVVKDRAQRFSNVRIREATLARAQGLDQPRR